VAPRNQQGHGIGGSLSQSVDTPFVAPDSDVEARARDAMKQPAYQLDAARRPVVRDAIVEICREKRWTLHALHVRSNHVHAVVSANRDPGRLMSDLKARASRDLNRAGFDSLDRIRWTRHGSTLHLFDWATVEAKARYTIEEQGVMMEFFDGREPRTK
jgi:REP element-mobilizing transposase RayT